MEWKTDWLFQLIVRDVEKIWQQALEESTRSTTSLAPDYLLLCQYADVLVQPYSEIAPEVDDRSLLNASLVSPLIKQWKFDQSGVTIHNESHPDSRKRNPVRGMFYQEGVFNFGFTPDRKLLYTSYTLGPRYGRGQVFKVQGQGQGRGGRLELHSGFRMWMS
ncbi:hypothetical protein EON83_17500 [bacterium]|nr:MAG: hypothetical protein EON83_17500 [bacterium]